MKTIAVILILFAGVANAGWLDDLIADVPGQHELVGTWQGVGGSITFYADGKLVLEGVDMTGAPATWEVIDIGGPKQLYMIVTKSETGEIFRKMMGIYKIVEGRLYVRAPEEYYTPMSRFMGQPSRIEYPTDFSSNVEVFTRVK